MTAWLRIPLQLATLALVLAVAGVSVIAGAYFYAEPSLPRAAQLRDVRLSTPLRVYARDGSLMTQYGEQKREPADYEDIPQQLINAILAAEDDSFFQHPGIDILSTIRAILNYGIKLVTRSDDRVPGGSTITQQIMRTTNLLPRDYALGRKVKEIFLAFRVENEFSKQEILRLYLNTYEFGHRSFGIVSAARTYFDKTLDQLSLSEIAIIAGIPNAPSLNNPYTSPQRAATRRAYVLRRMRELGYITEAERAAALEEPIVSQSFGVEIELSAGSAADMAIAECKRRFGDDACQSEGLRIFTTIDSRLQRAGNRSLRDGLISYDRNHGYRGAIARVDFDALGLAGESGDAGGEPGADPATTFDTLLNDYPDESGMETAIVLAVNDAYADVYFRDRGVVSVGFDAVSWAYEFRTDESQGPDPEVVGDVLEPGDVVRFERLDDGSLRLAQLPVIQGAFVSIDPMDGAIVALSGAFSTETEQFNRVTQARRQPGSAFKPFLYLSALAHGYTLASIVNDAPFRDCISALERCRAVSNYEGVYHGELPLRQALIRSLNAAADRVIRDITPSYTAEYVERFGFDFPRAERNASLALGAAVVTPLELANAYTILANGGYAVGIRPDPASRPRPYLIERIEDSDGHVLYDARLSVEYVCPGPDPEAAAADAARARAPRAELIGRRSDLYPPLRCAERVASAQLIYLITDVLNDVIQEGSGVRARDAFSPRRHDLRGKTGTTNDAGDAWFAGFNADIVAVARVGFDDDTRKLGSNRRTGSEQGGRTAIPIWIDYMKVALGGMPDHELPTPPGIVQRRVNPETGLIAAGCNPDTELEFFVIDNVPPQERNIGCGSAEPLSPDGGRGTQPLFE